MAQQRYAAKDRKVRFWVEDGTIIIQEKVAEKRFGYTARQWSDNRIALLPSDLEAIYTALKDGKAEGTCQGNELAGSLVWIEQPPVVVPVDGVISTPNGWLYYDWHGKDFGPFDTADAALVLGRKASIREERMLKGSPKGSF